MSETNTPQSDKTLALVKGQTDRVIIDSLLARSQVLEIERNGLKDELLLMTAGREQDGREHQNEKAELQRQLSNALNAGLR